MDTIDIILDPQVPFTTTSTGAAYQQSTVSIEEILNI